MGVMTGLLLLLLVVCCIGGGIAGGADRTDVESTLGGALDGLSERQKAVYRSYQHLYDPYPFDFRGFYWLRPPPVFRVADEKRSRVKADSFAARRALFGGKLEPEHAAKNA